MNRPSSPSNERYARWLERWLVPCLLIGVAIFQLIATFTLNLTPWKGGGFGMFAVADSPSMRVLAAEGLDTKGEQVQFEVLPEFSSAIERRMRSLPKQRDLEQIAPQLIGRELVPRRSRINEQDFGTADVALPSVFYRLRHADDPPPRETRTLQAVRLQWWTLKFDASQTRLYAEPLNPPVEAGSWRRPSPQP